MTTKRLPIKSVTALTVVLLGITACQQDFGGNDDSSPASTEDGASETEAAGGTMEDALPEQPSLEGEVVADGDSGTIRFGTGVGETSPQYIAASYFADLVDYRTDGRYEVEIYPNAQLGDDIQMMEGLQSGTLEMTYPSAAAASNIVPELEVLELPFMFPSLEAGNHFLESDLGDELLAEFEGTGIRALAFDEEGFRNLTTSGDAITSPEQVEGLSIRVQESPLHVDIWNSMGANPETMPFGELFSAMETGVIDAQENPWSTILSSSFYDVQDNGTETGHVYLASLIMMSEEFLDQMEPEDQSIIEEAAEATAVYKREVSRAYNEWAVSQLEQEGLTVTELDEEEQQAFSDATESVRDNWAQENQELYDSAEQVVEEFQSTQ